MVPITEPRLMVSKYYNTTNETGATLRKFRHAAEAQNDVVLKWFHDYGKPATPSQVWKQAFDASVPITSIRRAMTNLTKDRLLQRSERKTDGLYGRPEHYWHLPAKQIDLFGE